MRKRISNYILPLLLSSLLLVPVAGRSQTKFEKVTIIQEKEKVPFYQGTAIGVEVAGPISHLLGSDILNSEVQVQSNLKNMFFPTVEIGYGKTDSFNEDTELSYKTSAPYFRVGLDINAMYKKPHLPGWLLVGIRYGFTSFTYDVKGPAMQDPNYGGLVTVPFDYPGQKSKAGWVEIVCGMKARIYKGFCMGWSVRYKRRLSITANENAEAWYVPGFGKNGETSFNFTYNLIYNLPF